MQCENAVLTYTNDSGKGQAWARAIISLVPLTLIATAVFNFSLKFQFQLQEILQISEKKYFV